MMNHPPNVTKKQISETQKADFSSKDGTTFTGKVPNDPSRLTDITEISMVQDRDLQILRHVCTHTLYYLQTVIGINPIEVQAAWVPDLCNIYITGNVGAAIDELWDCEVYDMATILKGVEQAVKASSGDGPLFRRLKRHGRKLKKVKDGSRTFPDKGFADLASLIFEYGDVCYCDDDTDDPDEAGFMDGWNIVFLLHSHGKDKNVRHAEQIILEFLHRWNAPGTIAISGTKIPCFTCHAEFEWWSQYLDIRYVNMKGALFVNTINKNVHGQPKLQILHQHLKGAHKVNETADVDSDSDDEKMQ